MDNITMIAAVGKNLELGKNNHLIWPIKEDLAFFREQTMGKPIVMGMNTFDSLPRMLPGRKHIVLTSQDLILPQVEIVHSIGDLLRYIEEYQEEVMIIGGASLYKQMLEYARKLILTEIDMEDKDADAYFPEFNYLEWDREILSENMSDNILYRHTVYTKRK